MFKMKRALALVCTINMLFGNLSLDSFVMAESPAMVMEDPSAQVVAEVPSEMEADKAEKETRKDGDESSPRKDDTKVEVIDNPMDQVSVVSISLGDTRVITLDTVLALNIGATQRIAIAADAPVDVNVSRNGGRPVTYTYNNGKLETTFEAAAGSYELSFSSDQQVGAFTVRVENARSYVAENAGVKIENKDQSEKPEKKNKSDKAEEQNTGDASVTGETSAPAETVVETTLEIPEADTAVSTGSGSEAAGDTNDAAGEEIIEVVTVEAALPEDETTEGSGTEKDATKETPDQPVEQAASSGPSEPAANEVKSSRPNDSKPEKTEASDEVVITEITDETMDEATDEAMDEATDEKQDAAAEETRTEDAENSAEAAEADQTDEPVISFKEDTQSVENENMDQTEKQTEVSSSNLSVSAAAADDEGEEEPAEEKRSTEKDEQPAAQTVGFTDLNDDLDDLDDKPDIQIADKEEDEGAEGQDERGEEQNNEAGRNEDADPSDQRVGTNGEDADQADQSETDNGEEELADQSETDPDGDADQADQGEIENQEDADNLTEDEGETSGEDGVPAKESDPEEGAQAGENDSEENAPAKAVSVKYTYTFPEEQRTVTLSAVLSELEEITLSENHYEVTVSDETQVQIGGGDGEKANQYNKKNGNDLTLSVTELFTEVTLTLTATNGKQKVEILLKHSAPADKPAAPVEVAPEAVRVETADVSAAAEALDIRNETAEKTSLDEDGTERVLHTKTGYIGLDISVDESLLTENGLYRVPVALAEPIDLVGEKNIEVQRTDLSLYHIVNGNPEEIKDVTFETQNGILYGFTFVTDSFSPYMVSYTVDFHYQGVDYSIAGNSQILLSELIGILQIKAPDGDDDSSNDVPLNVRDVASVSFTDEHLVQVEQVSGLITYNGHENVDAGEKDFLLTSLQAFSSEEKLTIVLTDGTVIEVGVTDEESEPYTLPLYGYNFGGLYGNTRYADNITIGYPESVASDLTFDSLAALSALPFTYASDGFNVESIGLVEVERNSYKTKKYQVIGFALADAATLIAMSPDGYYSTYVSDALAAAQGKCSVLYGEKADESVITALRNGRALAVVWQEKLLITNKFGYIYLSATPTKVALGEEKEIVFNGRFTSSTIGDFTEDPIEVTLTLPEGLTFSENSEVTLAPRNGNMEFSTDKATISADRKSATFEVLKLNASGTQYFDMAATLDVTSEQTSETVRIAANNGLYDRSGTCSITIDRPTVKIYINGTSTTSYYMYDNTNETAFDIYVGHNNTVAGAVNQTVTLQLPANVAVLTAAEAIPTSTYKDTIENVQVDTANNTITYTVMNFSRANAYDIIRVTVNTPELAEDVKTLSGKMEVSAVEKVTVVDPETGDETETESSVLSTNSNTLSIRKPTIRVGLGSSYANYTYDAFAGKKNVTFTLYVHPENLVSNAAADEYVLIHFPDTVTIKNVEKSNVRCTIDNLRFDDHSISYHISKYYYNYSYTYSASYFDQFAVTVDVRELTEGETEPYTQPLTVEGTHIGTEEPTVPVTLSTNPVIRVTEPYFSVKLMNYQRQWYLGNSQNSQGGVGGRSDYTFYTKTLAYTGDDTPAALAMHGGMSFENEENPLSSLYMYDEEYNRVRVGHVVKNPNTGYNWTCVGFVPYTGRGSDGWDAIYATNWNGLAGKYYFPEDDGFSLADAKEYIESAGGILYGETPDEKAQEKMLATWNSHNDKNHQMVAVWFIAGAKAVQYNYNQSYYEGWTPVKWAGTTEGIQISHQVSHDGTDHVVYTYIIPEDMDEEELNLSNFLGNSTDSMNVNITQLPGDAVDYTIRVIDKSGKYTYKPESGAEGTVYWDGFEQVVGRGFENYALGEMYDGYSTTPRRYNNSVIQELGKKSGLNLTRPTDQLVGEALYKLGYGAVALGDGDKQPMTEFMTADGNPNYTKITQELLDDYYLDYFNSQYFGDNPNEDTSTPHFTSMQDLGHDQYVNLYRGDNSVAVTETNDVLANALYYAWYEFMWPISAAGGSHANTYTGTPTYMLHPTANGGNDFNGVIHDQWLDNEAESDGVITHTIQWKQRMDGEGASNAVQNFRFFTGVQFKLIKADGALRLTKEVTVNDQKDTTDRTDGTYAFEIKGADENTAGKQYYVQITYKNGEATSYRVSRGDGKASADYDDFTIDQTDQNKATVTLGGLYPGKYTVREVALGKLTLRHTATSKLVKDPDTGVETWTMMDDEQPQEEVTLTVVPNDLTGEKAAVAFTNMLLAPERYCVAVTKQWQMTDGTDTWIASDVDDIEIAAKLQRRIEDGEWTDVTGFNVGSLIHTEGTTGSDTWNVEEEGAVTNLAKDYVLLNKTNNWTAVALGVDQYDENFNRYIYQWVEGIEKDGKWAAYPDDGYMGFKPAETTCQTIQAQNVLTDKTELGVDKIGTLIHLIKITNVQETLTIRAYKVWNDDGMDVGRADVRVRLTAYEKAEEGGEPQPLDTAKASINNAVQTIKYDAEKEEWYVEWTGLPAWVNGKEVVYQVDELDSPAGYVLDPKKSSTELENTTETDENGNVTTYWKWTLTNTPDSGTLVINKRMLVDNVAVEKPAEDDTDTVKAENWDRAFYVTVSYVDAKGNTWYVTSDNGTLTKEDALTENQQYLTVKPSTPLVINQLKLGEYTVTEYVKVTEDGKDVYKQVSDEKTAAADKNIAEMRFVDAVSVTEVAVTVTPYHVEKDEEGKETVEGEQTEASLLNVYTTGKFCLAVTKQWIVNGTPDASDAPELMVKLQRKLETEADTTSNWKDVDGQTNIKLEKANNWSYVAVGLEQMNAEGVRYEYRWVETVPDGWAEGEQVEKQETGFKDSTDNFIALTILTNSKVDAEIPVRKTVKGNDYESPFTFTLTEPTNDDGENTNPAPIVTTAPGIILNKTVTELANGETDGFTLTGYTVPGTYKYIIIEDIPNDAVNADGKKFSEATEDEKAAGGFTKDGMTYAALKTVTVTVDWADTAKTYLKTTVTATEEAPAEFINTFSETTYAPVVIKALTGANAPTDVEFTFTLNGLVPGADDTFHGPVSKDPDTKSVTGAGEVNFSEITYHEAGEYRYTITETIPDDAIASYTEDDVTKTIKFSEYTAMAIAEQPELTSKFSKNGVSYNDKPVTLTVKVNADENGRLTVESATYTGGTGDDTNTITNTYAAAGKVEIQANKILSGRELEQDEFSFKLEALDGAPANKEDGTAYTTTELTVKNAANGTVSFPNLFYTESDIGRTYSYKISEVVGELGGINYDKNYYTVTVTVSKTDNDEDKDGDGKADLKVEKEITLAKTEDGKTWTTEDVTDIEFKNEYTADGKIIFEGVKTIEGRALNADDKFDFTLYSVTTVADDSTDPATETEVKTAIETVQNDKDGKFKFKALTYTLSDLDVDESTGLPKATTFTYEVRETSEDGNGITVDTNVYTVTVTVSDKGDSTLKVEADKDVAKINFKNTYEAEGSWTPEGTKALAGRDVTKDEYEFGLYEVVEGTDGTKTENKIETVRNDKDGNFTFSTVEYKKSELTFTKEKGEDGTTTEKATKNYVVREIIPADAINADGTAYSEADDDTKKTGGFKKDGITYDLSEYTIDVTITDNGDGTLRVEAGENATKLDFINTYEADDKTQIEAEKKATGFELKAGQFTFTLTPVEGAKTLDKDGNTITDLTAKNDASGKVVFPEFYYDETDIGKTYVYTFQETFKAEDVPDGYTYDQSVYLAEVKVEANEDEPSKLTITKTYYRLATGDGQYITPTKLSDKDAENNTIVPGIFNNKYESEGEVILEGEKTTTEGHAITEGEFSFELYAVTNDEGGNRVEEKYDTQKNDASGKVTFKAIRYSQNAVPGEYVYLIKEIVPTGEDAKAYYTYDKSEYEVTIKVEIKDGQLVVNDPVYKKVKDAEGNAIAAEEAETTTMAAFRNEYSATGSVEPEGKKTLKAGDENDTLTDGQFSFELSGSPICVKKTVGGDETLVTKDKLTVTNDAAGKVTFPTMYYSVKDIDKTYTYTITETTAGSDTLKVDTNRYTMTVTISDSGDGTLAVDKKIVDAEGNDVSVTGFEFINEKLGKITITKRVLKNGVETAVDADTNFHVALFTKDGTGYTVDATSIKTITVKAGESSGDAEWTKLPYGTYYVFEVKSATDPRPVGETYAIGTVTYQVTGGGEVVLNGDSADAPEIKNNHLIITAQPEVTKELTGRAWQADELNEDGTMKKAGDSFTFTLAAAQAYTGMTMPENATVTITSDSKDLKGIFDAVTFEQAGEYRFTITETEGSDTAITYDTTAHEVRIVVTEKETAGIKSLEISSITYDGEKALTVTNVYEAEGSWTPEGTKTLKGRDMLAGEEYNFTVMEGNKVVTDGTVTGGKDGRAENIVFNTISYTLEDMDKDDDGNAIPTTKTYTIAEQIPAGETDNVLDGVTYSGAAIEVKVTLTDNDDGTISAVPDAANPDVAFVNTYAAEGGITFEGVKRIEGRAMTAEDVFDFEISDGTTTQTVHNDETGKIAYPTFRYTLDDVGEKTYTVKETSKNGNGLTVDTTVYTIKVTIADNGDGTLKVEADQETGAIDFVNTYEANGGIELSGIKTLEGRELTAEDKFDFTLYEATGDTDGQPVLKEVETVQNSGAEYNEIRFKTIEYTLADVGIHTYVVRETSEDANGVTVSTEQYVVVVKVSDKGDGTLTVEKTENFDKLNFTNTYESVASVTFEGGKTLSGRDVLATDIFSFRITEGEGEEAKTWNAVSDPVTGKIEYPTISYTKDDAGEHTYKVKETSENGSGITVDTTEYTVVVEVTNTAGVVTAEITSENQGKGLDFTNTYRAEGEIDLAGTKTLENKALEDEQFTFTVSENGEVIQTVKNDADGQIKFEKITYKLDKTATPEVDDTGKHVYTVKETSTDGNGITVDTTEYEVTVVVADKGDGTLDVQYSSNAKTLDFVNTYEAEGSVALDAEKSLRGRTLKAGEFSFELKEGETVLQTKTNAADGSVKFDEIGYTLADMTKGADGKYTGSKTYTIHEVVPADAVENKKDGVTYTTADITVTVTLTEDGKGNITATADKKGEDAKFTNTYAAEGAITFAGTKRIEGRAMTAEDVFDFEISDGTTTQTVHNDATGKIAYPTFSYTLADVGEKTYTVKETSKDGSGLTVDKKEYTIKVTIADNGDGTLKVEADQDTGAIDFVNTYATETKVQFTAKKTLTSGDPERTLKDGEFTFTLRKANGEIIESVTNAGETVTFSEITYTTADAGTYGYEIVEQKQGDGSITYDEHIEKITVKVTDDGQGTLTAEVTNDGDVSFENKYETTESEVEKKWVDNGQTDKRPDSVTMVLMKNNVATDTTVTLTADNQWTGKVDKLPKYENYGDEIVYSFTEKEAGNDYQMTGLEIDGTKTTITNTWMPDRFSLTVLKVWEDKNNQDNVRPESISVQLMAGNQKAKDATGAEVAAVELKAANNWTGMVTNLPIRNVDGSEIAYSWVETLPEGSKYTLKSSAVSPDNDRITILTNTYEPEKVSVSVEKVWDDKNHEDKRPESIVMILTADGETVTTVTLDAANGWKATVNNLPMNKDGKAIAYNWDEASVPEGYVKRNISVVGSATTITNTYQTGKLVISKTFSGIPENVDVSKVSFSITGPGFEETVTYGQFTDGKYELGDLVPGKYTVVEDVSSAGITNYTLDVAESTISGAAAVTADAETPAEIELKNTYTEDKGELIIAKEWCFSPADAVNADEMKQLKVTVTNSEGKYALADGTLTDEKTELTISDGSRLILRDLPIDTYTVTETNHEDLITGYSVNSTVPSVTTGTATTVKGAAVTVVLKNNYERDYGSLTLKKTWEITGVTEVPDSAKNGLRFVITGTDVQGFEPITVYYAQFAGEETYTVDNLPTGTYTVTEYDHEKLLASYGYEFVGGTTTGEAEVGKDETAEVALRNEYHQKNGGLTITKTFSENIPKDADLSGLTFLVVNPNTGYRREIRYSEMTGGAITIEGLKEGVYAVSELNAGTLIDQYHLVAEESTTADSASVTEDGAATVALINTYAPNHGALKIVKTFSGAPEGADLSGLSFTVTGPNDYSGTFTYADFTEGELTISGLFEGAYTVTEGNAEKLIANYTLSTDSVTTGTREVKTGETAILNLVNIYDHDTGSLKITKTWSGIPEGAGIDALNFRITGPNGFTQDIGYAAFTDGSYTIRNLPVGEYTVEETNAETLISGYTLQVTASTTTATATVAKGGEATAMLTNAYSEQVGDLLIRKIVTGAEVVDFSELTFRIIGPHGFDETVKYSEFEGGEYTLESLPIGDYVVYETNANSISTQITMLSSSVTAVKARVTDGETTEAELRNNYETMITSVTVMKVWNDMDNLDGSRPAEIVMTLSNGMTATLNAGNDWTAEIMYLPVYDEKGSRITYTWTEAAVAGYTMTGLAVLGNTTVFTNTHLAAVVTRTVLKIWDDNDNAANLRPAVLRVTLSNDQTYYLNAANNWTVTVTDLPRYDSNGNEIRYEWTEQSVLGYTSSVNVTGDVTIFTNSYGTTPETPTTNPPVPRNRTTTIEEAPTPLAIEAAINHAGEGFD